MYKNTTKQLPINYIVEINRFYDWLDTNNISKSAISLWQALMHINNKAGWLDEFSVSMSVLELKTGFKNSELFKARNILQENGRIKWKKRGGNLSATYKMVFFSSHTMEINNNTNMNEDGNTNEIQTGTINKLEKNKSNYLLEEEDLKNLKYDIPDDGLPRNFEGLINILTSEIYASNEKAREIIIKSNYGQKKTSLWTAIKKMRLERGTKGEIKNPVNYILAALEKDKILNFQKKIQQKNYNN